MILIGQFDSPFVRRVGVAMSLYGIAFEQRPWSIFADAEKIAAHNPLIRVPVLLLENGEALVETFAILDHLDGLVPTGSRLIAESGPERRKTLQIMALASGLSDKAVSLFYELHLHEVVSPLYVARCWSQITRTLDRLEQDRASSTTPYWFGERLTHADIAVSASLRHLKDAHRNLFEAQRYPALVAHCEAMERLPVMQEISQPFEPPV